VLKKLYGPLDVVYTDELDAAEMASASNWGKIKKCAQKCCQFHATILFSEWHYAIMHPNSDLSRLSGPMTVCGNEKHRS